MRREVLGTKTQFQALESNAREAQPRDNRTENSRLLGARQYRRRPVDRTPAEVGDRGGQRKIRRAAPNFSERIVIGKSRRKSRVGSLRSPPQEAGSGSKAVAAYSRGASPTKGRQPPVATGRERSMLTGKSVPETGEHAAFCLHSGRVRVLKFDRMI